MTIDGINISTYGLRLLSMQDYYTLPAQKKILERTKSGYPQSGYTFKYESKQCTITLYGEYTTLAIMLININLFKTKIKTVLEHTFNLIGHNLTFTGVVAQGIKSEVIQKTVQLKFTITITTAL